MSSATKDDVCAICHEKSGLDFQAESCCKQWMHWKCVHRWAHEMKEFSCPCCRAALYLDRGVYVDASKETSAWYANHPKLFQWNKGEMKWNYNGPFPDMVTSFERNPDGSFLPAEVLNGMSNTDFRIEWNADRIKWKVEGDKRTFRCYPCQCPMSCGRGVVVLSTLPNDDLDIVQKRHGYVPLRRRNGSVTKIYHPDCAKEHERLIEVARKHTNGFTDGFYRNTIPSCQTKLLDILNMMPKFRNHRIVNHICGDCNKCIVALGREAESWRSDYDFDMYKRPVQFQFHRIRFSGVAICTDCVNENGYVKCKKCSSFIAQENLYKKGSQYCYPCHEKVSQARLFVENRSGYGDGKIFALPPATRIMDKNWMGLLNYYMDQRYQLFKLFGGSTMLMCLKSGSKTLRAVVSLQRAFRRWQAKATIDMTNGFKEGVYPLADYTAHNGTHLTLTLTLPIVRRFTPEGLYWTYIECETLECKRAEGCCVAALVLSKNKDYPMSYAFEEDDWVNYGYHVCPACSPLYKFCCSCSRDGDHIDDMHYYEKEDDYMCMDCFEDTNAETIQRIVRGWMAKRKCLKLLQKEKKRVENVMHLAAAFNNNNFVLSVNKKARHALRRYVPEPWKFELVDNKSDVDTTSNWYIFYRASAGATSGRAPLGFYCAPPFGGPGDAFFEAYFKKHYPQYNYRNLDRKNVWHWQTHQCQLCEKRVLELTDKKKGVLKDCPMCPKESKPTVEKRAVPDASEHGAPTAKRQRQGVNKK